LSAGAYVKSKSLKKVNALLAMALFGTGAYASTADQELLDILLKNGSINKAQYNSMVGKEGMASSQLLEILSKNGTITKDQYANLTSKNPSLAAAPAPVATLKTASTGSDGTHVTFGKNGGLEIFSNVKEKDKDGNEIEAPKKGPDGRPVDADGKPIVDLAGKPILDKDGKPLKPAYTKDFSFKIGGRIQVDSQINWNSNGPYGTDLSNGVGFRRARIYTEGVMFRDYEYRFEYDWARNNGGTQGITDAYLKYIAIPHFAITIGQQNEGKSMESVMSNNYLTFIERALPNNAFIEAGPNSKYQIGATAETWNKIAWSNDKDHPWDTPYTVRGGITTESVGAPGPGNSSGNSQGQTNNPGGTNPNGTNINRNAFSGDTSYQVVGRATFAPIYKKDTGVLHTGVWGSWRDVNNQYNADGTLRTGGWAYQSAPNTDVDRTNWINTGNLSSAKVCAVTVKGVCTSYKLVKQVNNIAMFGAELAGAYGPVHLTAEYMQAQIAGYGYSGSDTLQGYSVQGGWFLTGENRPYDVKRGAWDRLIPLNSFVGGSGWGAFEIAGRYDLMDMNTLHINGGSINTGSLALNWYLTPRVRFMTNWVHVFTVNNNNSLKAAGGKCAFPAQGSGAGIGCFSGLSPDIWEMAVRLDY
jgi:phosphate-selective porin OprO/OprP